jgi:hypothetical protein
VSDDQPQGPAATAPYRFAEQHTPPPAVPVSDVARTTFAHVYEVEPRLMQEHVLQQVFPNWDTLRIMRSRADHLDWMHAHFADEVLVAGEESETMPPEGEGLPSEAQAGPRPEEPDEPGGVRGVEEQAVDRPPVRE